MIHLFIVGFSFFLSKTFVTQHSTLVNNLFLFPSLLISYPKLALICQIKSESLQFKDCLKWGFDLNNTTEECQTLLEWSEGLGLDEIADFLYEMQQNPLANLELTGETVESTPELV
ncbi:MAG: hypothetical protein RCO49_04825 [Rickettsia endosymbiont of Argas persicus]